MKSSPNTARLFAYQYLTVGIYFWIWCNRLGQELNAALRQKVVPSLWWFVVPGGVYYWMWCMTGALETATGRRMKQADTFLLYVVLSGAVLAGFGYVPNIDVSHSADNSTHSISLRLVLIILAVLVAVALVVTITLHAVFMNIVQKRLDRIRAGVPVR